MWDHLTDARANGLEDHGRDHVWDVHTPLRPGARSSVAPTLKNRMLLENPTAACVDPDSRRRYYQRIGNVTSANADFGYDTATIKRRDTIKQLTFKSRHLKPKRQAA